MKLKKKDKIQLVNELSDKLKEDKTFLITNYEGLTSKESNELRLKLFDEGIKYTAFKKKLINLALEQANLEGVDTTSEPGQLALAWGEDGAVLAKTISSFGKDKEIEMIVAGFLDGEFLPKDRVIALSKLPSLDMMRAQFIGALKSTMSGLVNVLNGNQRKLVVALSAIAESKS